MSTAPGTTAAGRDEWMISVDDHLVEPPHLWTTWLPSKFADAAPRVIRTEAGDRWLVEDKLILVRKAMALVGLPDDERDPQGLALADLGVDFDAMHPGCFDPVARLADMDTDRVLASMPFPTMPRFCGQTFFEMRDRDLGLACVQAYNDFLLDEWCAAAPGRYIACVLIPLWDPQLAATELRRCARKGASAFAFSEMPHELGLPSIHDADGFWDPVFAAACDTGLAVCTHLGSSSVMPTTSPDAPEMVGFVLTPMNLMRTCVDWLFSGKFAQFPDLKLVLSEGGIGWIPYVLELCETTSRQVAWWSGDGRTDVRQVFRDHIYGCFIEDELGVAAIHDIGIDNVMIETDYPHQATSWPDSMDIAQRRLAGFSAEDRFKVLRGNAERLFSFTPAAPPASADPTALPA